MHHAKVVPGIERTAALLQSFGAATPVQDQPRRSGKSWQGPGSLLRGGEPKIRYPQTPQVTPKKHKRNSMVVALGWIFAASGQKSLAGGIITALVYQKTLPSLTVLTRTGGRGPRSEPRAPM